MKLVHSNESNYRRTCSKEEDNYNIQIFQTSDVINQVTSYTNMAIGDKHSLPKCWDTTKCPKSLFCPIEQLQSRTDKCTIVFGAHQNLLYLKSNRNKMI